MKLPNVVRDRRALVLRLVAAEVLARPGEGPLARRRVKWRPRSKPAAPTR